MLSPLELCCEECCLKMEPEVLVTFKRSGPEGCWGDTRAEMVSAGPVLLVSGGPRVCEALSAFEPLSLTLVSNIPPQTKSRVVP